MMIRGSMAGLPYARAMATAFFSESRSGSWRHMDDACTPSFFSDGVIALTASYLLEPIVDTHTLHYAMKLLIIR